MKHICTLALLLLLSSTGLYSQPAFSMLTQASVGGTFIDAATRIAPTPDGGLVVAGNFRDVVDFQPGTGSATLEALGSPDVFLASYASDYTLNWVINLGRIALSNGMDARGLKVDASGAIFLAGAFSTTVDFDPSPAAATLTSMGLKDVFLAKYNPTGSLQWVKQVGSPGADAAGPVALGSDGSIRLSMYFSESADIDPGASVQTITASGGTDIAVLALNSAGDYQWHWQMGTAGNDACTALTLSDNGQLAFGGYTNGSSTVFAERELYAALLSAEGGLLWSLDFQNSEQDNQISSALFTQDGSGVIFGGRVRGITDFDPSPDSEVLISPQFADPFVARYQRSDGSLVWARYLAGQASEDYSAGIFEIGGALVSAGSFEETIIFDTENFSDPQVSAGGQDVFFAAFQAATGQFITAATFGSSGTEQCVQAVFDTLGNGLLCGSYAGSLGLVDGDSDQSQGFSDAFIGQFSFQTNLSLAPTVKMRSLRVYPTPARDAIFVELPAEAASADRHLRLYNLAGMCVLQVPATGALQRLDVAALPRGYYSLHLSGHPSPAVGKLILY